MVYGSRFLRSSLWDYGTADQALHGRFFFAVIPSQIFFGLPLSISTFIPWWQNYTTIYTVCVVCVPVVSCDVRLREEEYIFICTVGVRVYARSFLPSNVSSGYVPIYLPSTWCGSTKTGNETEQKLSYRACSGKSFIIFLTFIDATSSSFKRWSWCSSSSGGSAWSVWAKNLISLEWVGLLLACLEFITKIKVSKLRFVEIIGAYNMLWENGRDESDEKLCQIVSSPKSPHGQASKQASSFCAHGHSWMGLQSTLF